MWLFGLLTAMSVLAGIVAYTLDRDEVDESLDGQLRQLALTIGSSDIPRDVSRADGVSLDPEDAFMVTIWGSDGQPRSSDLSFITARPAGTGYTNFEVGGEMWRGYARASRERTVLVAQRLVVRQEFAANSAWRAILPIAALIPLSLVLVGWVVTRVLRPLNEVTNGLQQWRRSRTNPLPLTGVPDEIMPLALATNDLISRLQAQLEFRERFISDAAHELRTPLTALRLQAENLAGSAGSAEQAALVGEMSDGVRRMSKIVSELLQLARADSSAPTPNPVAVDLGDAIRACLQDLVPIAREKEIDLGLVSSASEQVLADPDELRILIGNLVENAVRYTGRGGTIDLSVERSESEIVFEVRDTGPGIAPDDLDRVFARFVRGSETHTEGSGLGLPIVRAIAERYAARVTLLNRRDRSGLIARVTFLPI